MSSGALPELALADLAQSTGISVHTQRNWEQGRVVLDGLGLALLLIAARHPRIIRQQRESAAESRHLPNRTARPVLRLAVAQFPVSGDVSRHVGHISRLVAQAALQGAKLVHFPECALTGGANKDSESVRCLVASTIITLPLIPIVYSLIEWTRREAGPAPSSDLADDVPRWARLDRRGEPPENITRAILTRRFFRVIFPPCTNRAYLWPFRGLSC